jgi:hypothetical protein
MKISYTIHRKISIEDISFAILVLMYTKVEITSENIINQILIDITKYPLLFRTRIDDYHEHSNHYNMSFQCFIAVAKYDNYYSMYNDIRKYTKKFDEEFRNNPTLLKSENISYINN